MLRGQHVLWGHHQGHAPCGQATPERETVSSEALYCYARMSVGLNKKGMRSICRPD